MSSSSVIRISPVSLRPIGYPNAKADEAILIGGLTHGDVYLGNANGYEASIRPTAKNVLAGQANRQPRGFTIRCVATGTLEDAFVCRGSDSLGNLYAGNSRNPANPNFFKLR